jgi:hypothetical protein
MPYWSWSAVRRGNAPITRILGALALLSWSASAWAGGGPEGVLLVVNPRSASSLTIANHYAQLRQIPLDNVLYLPWEPNAQTTDIDSFRRQILLPVLRSINQRRWGDQIDYVVYSSDFPTAIGLGRDLRKLFTMPEEAAAAGGSAEGQPGGELAAKPEWPKIVTPVGSLNGLTFLWQTVLTGNRNYLSMRSNHFMPRLAPGEGSRAFRGNRQYGPQGTIVTTGGERYFLSVVLGVTTGRGNSLDEVLAYLKRSAAADGIRPPGTIYFVKNDDIRSKVRDPLFPVAVEQLKKLGVVGEILEGTVPLGKNDVQGLVMGTALFDWKASGSTIRPGAICEHFTSFGGAMSGNPQQTSLAEFLRYGAAGASGTVTEPYSVPAKFPSPLVQVHYARGCSLAEAFYQSVSGPYQLLIVGDPLCRPWADIPQVSVTGVEPGAVVRGELKLQPAATVAGGRPVEIFEAFVDGQRAARCKAGEMLALDSAKWADGYHEVRVVAVGPAPIESQGRKIIPVWADNHQRTIEAALSTPVPVEPATRLVIAVRSPGSVGIVAMQGNRVVGRVAGAEGRIEVPAALFGAGPVQLRVVGLGAGDVHTHVIAKPIEFTVLTATKP